MLNTILSNYTVLILVLFSILLASNNTTILRMKKLLTSLFLFSTISFLGLESNALIGQVILNQNIQLDWTIENINLLESSEAVYQINNGTLHEDYPEIPFLHYLIPVDGPGKLSYDLVVNETKRLDEIELPSSSLLQEDYYVQATVQKNGNQYFALIEVLPAKLSPSGIQGIKTGQLTINFQAQNQFVQRNPPTEVSKLASGTFHKIAVQKSGVFKISAAFISSELGISLSSINPSKIKLYGHGGGRLPILAGSYDKDDLPEIPITIIGDGDNSFDSNDYILFYGEGANNWTYNEIFQELEFNQNTYATENYYFLSFDDGSDGLRIAQSPVITGEADINTYDQVKRIEPETYNILEYVSLNQGSGQQWFGDLFKNLRSKTYSINMPNLITTEPIQFSGGFASRASASGSTFEVTINGQTESTTPFAGTSFSNSNAVGAHYKYINSTFSVNQPVFDVLVDYPNFPNSEGWLDYLEFTALSNLIKGDGQLTFQSYNAQNYNSVNYKIQSSGSIIVWDITNNIFPISQAINTTGNTHTFGSNSDTFKRFISFNTAEAFEDITYEGTVPNQNLHGLAPVDMVIICPEVFLAQANKLADHRSSRDGLSISIIQPNQIYNEYASGRQDAAAIRNFLKHLYEKDPEKLKYVLLFGDGTFDNRNILGLGNNYVPTYETEESLRPIHSYPTDDFYGLLDDGEGIVNQNNLLNLRIGRLPVKTIEQANQLVDKIIRYDNKSISQGDWKIRTVYVADDEDGMKHTRDCDSLAMIGQAKYPWMNQDKVYIDAFEQESTSFGTRVPEARSSINNNLFRGALAVTYLGHGGSIGWAQERILQISDILSWNNKNKLPVFLTATCSFSGYDDPNFTSGGEQTILNPDGGAIAMFTTVRAVYANDNYDLSRVITDTLFSIADGAPLRFGDALIASKNAPQTDASNHRKFTLLGDPSQAIAVPAYEVVTTEINGNPILSGTIDTLSALELVTIKGQILDFNGQLATSFNGQLYPSVFDKRTTNQTLGQDSGSSVYTYSLQKNIIFKGLVSITNGTFEFSFVVPKDISFEFGQGKISYYAIEDDGQQEAKGYNEDIIIGGSSDNAIQDDQGPIVEVYMNSEDFVFGGITSSEPLLYVKLEDDYGINVTGNSIGHDLTGTLDEQTQSTFLLNDYYQSELDDYRSGTIRYPLTNISEGRHEIRVKAWDIANNSSEGYTEFVVSSSGKIALEQVLNYPNPFSSSTCFQFEHNMEGQIIDVSINIYTIAGRLVKTLHEQINPVGSRLGLGDCIQWDGTDDFGDPLATGVYVYKINARTLSGGAEIKGDSAFEKLVIIK